MQIIKPIVTTGNLSITPAMLTSSTVPEPDTAYNEIVAASSLTTPFRPYVKDDVVLDPVSHNVYKTVNQNGTKSIVTLTTTGVGAYIQVNWANHGLPANTPIKFTTTNVGGVLLPPVNAATTYYLAIDTANSFLLLSSPSGSVVNSTSTSQSGVHTAYANFDLLSAGMPELNDITKWQKTGVSNRFSPFDRVANTQAKRASSEQYVLNPGQIVNAIGFVGMDAASIRVRNNTGYDVTKNLDGSTIINWPDYFFEQSEAMAESFFLGLGNNANPTLTIDINKTGIAKAGEIILGKSYDVGGMQYGPTSGTTNYSLKNTDAFGSKTVVVRPKANRFSGKLYIPKASIGKIKRLIDSILDIPCFFIGVDDPDYSAALNVFGFVKDFVFQHDYVKHSLYTIEIEGLT